MHRIINSETGDCLGVTDSPVFVRPHENGCFVLCPEPEAQGISFAGTVYQLQDRPSMGGTEVVVMLEAMDAGAELAAVQQTAADNDAMNVDHELRLTMLEMGLADPGESI